MRTESHLAGTLSLLMVAVGSLLSPYPARTQSSPAPAPAQLIVSAATPPVLEVYNFALAGGAEGSEQRQALQIAVPDSLFIRVLGDPRVDVRRVRQGYTATPARNSDVRSSDIAPKYALDGKIAFIEPRIAGAAPADRSGAPTFVVITYCLRELGREPQAKSLIEKDETTVLAQLPAALRRISNQVVLSLVPPPRVSLFVSPPQLTDVPAARTAFYEQNLPQLLNTQLSRQTWIDLTQKDDATADYALRESVSSQKGHKAYDLQITILRKGIAVPPVLHETATDTEVLATQLRLASRVIDSLKALAALAPGSNSPMQPSAADYLQTAHSIDKTDPDVATALYRKALDVDPANLDAKISLAFVFINKNQPDDALDILSSPDLEAFAQAQYVRSIAFNYKDKPKEALDAANRAVELAPQQDIAYVWRGYLYSVREEYPKAVADFDAARKINPKEPDYYQRSAAAYEALGKYDDAIAVLNEGRQQTADGPRLAAALNDTRRRAAAYYLNKNNPGQALNFARDSLAEDKDSEWGHRLMGIAYHRLGRLSEAEQSLQTARKIKETEPACEELAGVYLDLGNKEDAFQLAEKAIEIDGSTTGPYVVFENGVTGPEEARKVISWLKIYAAKNPPARYALQEWDYFYSAYLFDDASGIADLYSAYVSATKSVPYREWIDGWANLVELDMITGKYEDAASISRELLKIAPKTDYQLGLRFYLWVSELLWRNCEGSQLSLKSFVELLSRPELQGFETSWVFGSTRRFLESKAKQGAFALQTQELVESALGLLDSHTLKKEQIDEFLTRAKSPRSAPCSPTGFTAAPSF